MAREILSKRNFFDFESPDSAISRFPMTLMKSMASLHQGPNFFVIIYLRLGTASLNLNCSNATNSDSSKLPMTANTNLIFHPFFFFAT
jgi:hypothetical protein